MRGIAIAALAAMVGTSGCGVLMMDPPRDRLAPFEPPACKDTAGGSVLDSMFALGFGIGALGAASAEEGGTFVALGLITTAFVGSAVAGFRAASRCKDANLRFEARIEDLRARAEEPETDAEAEPHAVAEADPVAEAAAETDPATETAAETDPVTATDPPTPTPTPTATATASDFASPPIAPPPPREEPTPRRGRPPRWTDFWQEVRP